MTSQNAIHKSYWFEEGYIRTSSTVFTLKNLSNKMIHLTNDAIQKKSEEYGKFEDHVLVLLIDSIGDGRRAERWLQDWASS